MKINNSVLILTCSTVLVLATVLQAGAYSFSNGSRVETTANLVVHATDSTGGTVVTTETQGSRGTIASSSYNDGTYTWWYINWNNGYSGYSVDAYLEPVPTLTVTSPNGGENWTAGSTHTVAWTATGDTSAINYQYVAYSTNGGISFTTVSPVLTPSTRSYSWTLPTGITSSQARIRVRIMDVYGYILAEDISDNNFAITSPAPAPSITSVSPAQPTGSSSAQPFTINGANFVSGCNVTLRVGGSTYANRAISAFSSTAITINPIFTTVAQRWTVEVINPDGQSSGQFSFNVVAPAPAPSITSVSPAQPTGSSSAQPFTINGANFVSGCNVTLRVGGSTYANRAISAFSSTAVTINPIFTTVGQTWAVEVINPDGQSSGQFSFNVVAPAPAPSITSLSPNPVVGANTPQIVTINGANFVNKPTLTLTWPGQTAYTVPPAYVTYISSSQLQMLITTGTDPSTWTFKATNPDNQTSGAFTFQVNAPVPAITSISPTSAGAGSGTITLTLNGRTFQDASIVQANGNNLATTAHDSPGGLTTYLTATLPSSYLASAGTLTITVYSPGPGGGTSPSAPFTVNGAQSSVLSVTPANPATQPATAGTIPFTVSITGGTISYSASVLSGSSWLHISSGGSGANSGTLVVSYDQNTGAQRSGTIQVTANGASGSPVTITVMQGMQTQVLGADFNAGGRTINWQQEMSISPNFLIMKAAQGDNPNRFLPSNMSDVPPVNNGFTFGVYDYADPDERANPSTMVTDPSDSAAVMADAQAAANTFCNNARTYLTAGHMLPAVDLEDEQGNPPGGFNSPNDSISDYPKWTWPEIAQWIAAWTKQMQHNDPRFHAFILYMPQGYAENISPELINSYLPAPVSYNLWIVDINNSPNIDPNPSIGSWPAWAIEQYDWSGTTPPGDLDVMNPSTPLSSLIIEPSQCYTVTPSVGSSGNINPSTPQTVPILGGVIFTASPATQSARSESGVSKDGTTSYVVDQWLVNGIPAQTGGTNFRLVNVTADTAVQVSFKPAPVVSYTVTPSAAPNGSISPNSAQSVGSGDSMAFSGLPNPGCVVDQWLTNNVAAQSGGTSFTVANVTADTAVQVTFVAVPAATDTVTASPVPAYGGMVSGGGAFTDGSQQTVTATANPGYSFINWTENGIEVSSSTNYAFTLRTNRALVANFTATQFILSDKDAPALFITQPYSSGVFVATTNVVTLAGTASDLGHGDNGISIVTVNGVEANGDTTANGGTANWNLPVTLSLGTNVFTVVGTDNSPSANSTTTTLVMNYQPRVQMGTIGMWTNQFGFTIIGTSNQVIVVEACTSLGNPAWFPVGTNTLTGSSCCFSDRDWTNHRCRFYRLRSP